MNKRNNIKNKDKDKNQDKRKNCRNNICCVCGKPVSNYISFGGEIYHEECYAWFLDLYDDGNNEEDF